MTTLPAYLAGISRVVVDEGVAASAMAARVRDRLPLLPWDVLPAGVGLEPGLTDEILYLKEYRGRFLRPCPGTSHYHCCGYQIIHIGENCPIASCRLIFRIGC